MSISLEENRGQKQRSLAARDGAIQRSPPRGVREKNTHFFRIPLRGFYPISDFQVSLCLGKDQSVGRELGNALGHHGVGYPLEARDICASHQIVA